MFSRSRVVAVNGQDARLRLGIHSVGFFVASNGGNPRGPTPNATCQQGVCLTWICLVGDLFTDGNPWDEPAAFFTPIWENMYQPPANAAGGSWA